MAINKLFQPLAGGPLGYSAAVQTLEFLTGVNIHHVRFRLTALVTVSGGTADGTLRSEGVQRFLRAVRIVHDGFDVVSRISGRTLYAMSAHFGAARTSATNLSTAGVQTNTPVAMDFMIPFARPYLAKPFDTVWPGGIRTLQEFLAFIEFETTPTTPTSSPGSDAFITGGDRTVTISNVRLDGVQVYSHGLYVPRFLPIIRVANTAQFLAANTELPLRVLIDNSYDAVFLSYLNGASQNVQDGINSISFVAGGGGIRYIDRVPTPILEEETRAMFPGVTAAEQAGRLFILHADNGLLGARVEPSRLSDPRYIFDVAAPTSNPGFVECVFMAHLHREGITRGMD